MAFRDLRDIIGPLELPVGGKTYTLPVVSAADGARIRLATEKANAGDKEESISTVELERIVLGDVLNTMREDGLAPEEIDRVFYTGLADVQRGRQTAELIWEHGVDPKALQAATTPPNRAARRKTAKTRTGAATTTKRPASTNGTKTPTK